ncbi:MAG: hypothetical protein QXL54_05185 [Candidatus Bathyarchaeia archaeon]
MEQVKNNRQIVRASFNVEKGILDDFRKAVAQKYGRLWGVLCLEFEKALKLRLEQLRAEINKN